MSKLRRSHFAARIFFFQINNNALPTFCANECIHIHTADFLLFSQFLFPFDIAFNGI